MLPIHLRLLVFFSLLLLPLSLLGFGSLFMNGRSNFASIHSFSLTRFLLEMPIFSLVVLLILLFHFRTEMNKCVPNNANMLDMFHLIRCHSVVFFHILARELPSGNAMTVIRNTNKNNAGQKRIRIAIMVTQQQQ